MEIGGLSAIFGPEGALPVYPVCRTVDGCNYYASVTVWEGTIADDVYRYDALPLGRQYIGEATEVSALVKPAAYDFVVSSNCLEHVANPVKALKAWLEILKPGGVMLLIVPNKKHNFDRFRPDTSFGHLVRDYENNVTEADMTHYREIVSLHDRTLDSRAGDADAFRERCRANAQNRCFHHHVFTPDCLSALFEYLDIPVLFRCSTEADHIILGQKK
ncbi:MAG: class I SAM-dependent methyltransferase [Parabacteroides sp.]|nr:class I SAM-dependent methyltransferase [Parabacteroides sp.]